MADKTLLDTETIARKYSDSGSNALLDVDDQRQASRKTSRQSSIEQELDSSRMISSHHHITSRQISTSESIVPGSAYDDGASDSKKVNPEERLARNRIKNLHDVFVSAQGGEGLNMEEFRSAMRQVFSDEYGRKVEDHELDKVAAI